MAANVTHVILNNYIYNFSGLILSVKYHLNISYTSFMLNMHVYRSVLISWSRSSDSGLTFQHSTYYGEVLENSTKITAVTLVSTVGSHLNEHIIFSILNPTLGFQIGPTTGILSTSGVPFDRENTAHYELIIQVSVFTNYETNMICTFAKIQFIYISYNKIICNWSGWMLVI